MTDAEMDWEEEDFDNIPQVLEEDEEDSAEESEDLEEEDFGDYDG